MAKTVITLSESDTEALGREFASTLKRGDVVALFGSLGAGKTAFTRGAMHGIGYNGYVSSPTFSIVNEYRVGDLRIYHFDMYRVTSEDDLASTGFYDYFDGSGIAFIEWGDRIVWAIPEGAKRVYIEGFGDGERTVRIEGI